jgi:hypothetical protein
MSGGLPAAGESIDCRSSVLPDLHFILKNMKTRASGIALLALVASVAGTANAVSYKIKRGDGTIEYYRLEVPPNVTLTEKNPDPHMPYAKHLKMSDGAARVAAVGWAGGLSKDKTIADPYPNSMTNIGADEPGGFYNASYIKVESVEHFTTPVPHYLVRMNGKIDGVRQTLYADVLDDTRIVRPVAVTTASAWGGSGMKKKDAWGAADEKPKSAWGGAEEKEKANWGGANAKKKSDWGGAEAKKKSAWGGAEEKDKANWGGANAKKKSDWGGAEEKDKADWGGANAKKKSDWGGAEEKDKANWGGANAKKKKKSDWGGAEKKQNQ